jgi:hypothetical protein
MGRLLPAYSNPRSAMCRHRNGIDGREYAAEAADLSCSVILALNCEWANSRSRKVKTRGGRSLVAVASQCRHDRLAAFNSLSVRHEKMHARPSRDMNVAAEVDDGADGHPVGRCRRNPPWRLQIDRGCTVHSM